MINIALYILYNALLIIASFFVYYLVRSVRLMKDSVSRQSVLFGAILSVLALLMEIWGRAFSSLLYLLSSVILLWILSSAFLLYGQFMIWIDMKRAYEIALIKVIFEGKRELNNVIGALMLLCLGLPVHIYALYSESTSWLNALGLSIIGFAVSNLSLAAKSNFRHLIRAQTSLNEFTMESADPIVRSYSALINSFLSSMNLSSLRLSELIDTFIEYNPILLEGCKLSFNGLIDFSPVEDNLSRIHKENRGRYTSLIFSALLSKIYGVYANLTSRKHAEVVLSNCYDSVINPNTDRSVAYEILRSLPEGMLERQKVSLLTRDEMEEIIRERTRELEESHNYINSIVNNVPDMLFVLEPDATIRFVNKMVVKLLGYTQEELIGQSIECVFSDETLLKMGKNTIKEIIINEDVENIELEFSAKDGELVNVLFSTSFLHGPFEDVTGIVCIAQDITGLKQAERATRESEEKNRLIVENAREGIIVVQDNVVKFANKRAIELAFNTQSDMDLAGFIKKIHPDDKFSLMRKYLDSINNGRDAYGLIFRLVDEDCQTKKWFESNVIGVEWEGRPASLIFIDDITERHKFEEELLRVKKLETVALLAGGIAHDFRNYLGGVVGNLSTLKNLLQYGTKEYELASKIEKAANLATGLTQQLLTFAKGGEPIIKLESIRDVVMETAELALSGSGVKCEYRVTSGLWNAMIDRSQIEQVINNLVVNARQAMNDRGTIIIHMENEVINDNPNLNPGMYVKICVEDHGVGIPEDNITRIFDPFFTTKPDGTGLGLAIVHSIVKKHKGHITVKSQVGVGTKFFIYLPASPEHLPEEEPPRLFSPIISQRSMTKAKILVMDDEEIVRDMAQEMLEMLGFEVVVAKDGEEMINIYEEHFSSGDRFDAVIMDLTVPGGIDGTEAIRKLREIDPTVKAIVSSGYSNDKIMVNYEKYSFSAAIAKPYTIDELDMVLRNVLES